MRFLFLYFLTLSLLITSGSSSGLSAQTSTPLIPELLMPEILGQLPNVRDFAVDPLNGDRYITVESVKKEFSAILVMKEDAKTIADIRVAPFSGRWKDLEPAFHPDGSRLYFVSNRPDEGEEERGNFAIWYLERAENGGWSDPVNPGPPLNTESDEFYPSLTMDGDLYFTAERTGTWGKEDIFLARPEGTGFGEPIALDTMINSTGYEFNAYVSPG